MVQLVESLPSPNCCCSEIQNFPQTVIQKESFRVQHMTEFFEFAPLREKVSVTFFLIKGLQNKMDKSTYHLTYYWCLSICLFFLWVSLSVLYF